MNDLLTKQQEFLSTPNTDTARAYIALASELNRSKVLSDADMTEIYKETVLVLSKS